MLKSRVFAVFCIFLFSILQTMAQQTGNTDGSVYVIPLKENVDRYLGVFVGRAMEQAQREGAKVIILEIDTFGGRVDTALEIAGRIGSAQGIRTIAYIPADSGGRGVSWSAGALMAFSASEIWMAPGTSMGAAAPVIQSAEGTQGAGEKAVSAVRGQMAALAEKNGYPKAVALAMVDADIELREIFVNGELSLATSQDIEGMENLGEEPTIGRTISEKGKLLTLTSGEMEEYGISSGTVADRNALLDILGYSTDDLVVLNKNQPDRILTLLTSGAVTSILLLAALVALYLEITSPGFGLPGTIALICFSIVFVSSGLIGNLGAAEILMFVAGVILLLLEIFIIPGFGVAGISGILLILISLVFSLQDFYWPRFEWEWTQVWRNLVVVGTGVLGGIVSIGILMGLLPRAGLLDRLVLHGPGDPGYADQTSRKSKTVRKHAMEPRQSDRKQDSIEDNHVLPAQDEQGIAITDLRPVGKVRFGKKSVVCETDGEYYEKGTQVYVLRTDGINIIVSAVEET